MPSNRKVAQNIADSILLAEQPIPLARKPISLPMIPCENNEPEPDWHQLLHRHCDDTSAHDWESLYQSIQEHRIESWEKTARTFEATPGDFYNAWNYLDSHPVFWRFHGEGQRPTAERIHERYLMHDRRLMDSITIDAVKVNPNNHRVADDRELNTLTQVWIEMGKWGWPGTETGDPHNRDAHWHDPDLDCGGDTVEQAIITAAIHLHTAYGNDRQHCEDPQ